MVVEGSTRRRCAAADPAAAGHGTASLRTEKHRREATVHWAAGDWSIFRLIDVIDACNTGRKHGPVPLLPRLEHSRPARRRSSCHPASALGKAAARQGIHAPVKQGLRRLLERPRWPPLATPIPLCRAGFSLRTALTDQGHATLTYLLHNRYGVPVLAWATNSIMAIIVAMTTTATPIPPPCRGKLISQHMITARR